MTGGRCAKASPSFEHRVTLLALILLALLILVPIDARCDIAPIDVVEGGSYGILVHETDLTMREYHVKVVVDLPDVVEDLEYVISNPANETVTRTVIVPYFGVSHMNDPEFQLIVDGSFVTSYIGSVSLDPDLLIDASSLEGIIATIEFPANSTTRVRARIEREFDPYTKSFEYFYSAETSRYWQGNVSIGSFTFEYRGRMESMEYFGPDHSITGRTIRSNLTGFDGQVTYRVVVDTGIRKEPWIRPVHALICVATVILVLVSIFLLYRIQQRSRPPRRTVPLYRGWYSPDRY